MESDFVVDVENVKSIVKNDGPILVVDDDEDQNFIVEKCYELSGKQNNILFLNDGQELVEYMEKVIQETLPMPELILLDINMPGVNGFEALKQIRSIKYFENIPVIVMFTASNSLEDQEKAEKLGANGFWTKPLNVSTYKTFFEKI